jgi:hypothetical protein
VRPNIHQEDKSFETEFNFHLIIYAANRGHSRVSTSKVFLLKIRRALTRHDNIEFGPMITRTSNVVPLSVVTADKGYDSEDNHLLVRDYLNAFSIIPSRYERVPIWRTHGRYRKQMNVVTPNCCTIN